MKRFLFYILQLIALAGLSVLLFNQVLELSQRHNRFEIGYHPDETSKAGQILRDDWNFNHPLLMLETAMKLIERQKTPRSDYEEIVYIGRDASAHLAAAAAVLLAWAGWYAARWPGFVLMGLAGGFCPAIISHAHYFKEEAALSFGIACVICGAALLSRRRHWSLMLLNSLLLGAAVGVAASGKYVGAVMAAPAIIMVVAATWGRWWIMPLCVALMELGVALSWTQINHRALEHWDDFLAGVNRETSHAISEHGGITMNKPNGYFIDATWTEAMPHVKVLAITAPLAMILVAIVRRRPKPVPAPAPVIAESLPNSGATPVLPYDAPPPAESAPRPGPGRPSLLFGWWLIVALTIYAISLSYSVIPFYRYAVPVTLMLYLLAGLACVYVAWVISARWWVRGIVTMVAAILIGMWQYARCDDFANQFGNDSRDNLRKWADDSIPRGSTISADGYTQLGSTFRASVMRDRWASDIGSVSEQRSRGVQYIAIASSSYERWLSPYSVASPGDEFWFKRRAEFYNELFEKYPIVWQQKAEHPTWTFTNPDIYVFQINKGPKKPGK